MQNVCIRSSCRIQGHRIRFLLHLIYFSACIKPMNKTNLPGIFSIGLIKGLGRNDLLFYVHEISSLVEYK